MAVGGERETEKESDQNSSPSESNHRHTVSLFFGEVGEGERKMPASMSMNSIQIQFEIKKKKRKPAPEITEMGIRMHGILLLNGERERNLNLISSRVLLCEPMRPCGCALMVGSLGATM